MTTQVLIFYLILASFVSGTPATTITITNNCPHTIWPGTLTGSGSPLSITGFELPSKSSKPLNITPPWSGRFWARTLCSTDSSPNKFTCETADCTSNQISCNGNGAVPPASLVEFTIAPYNGLDFYDVSLVDGFNLPVSVVPQGGFVYNNNSSDYNCTASICRGDVNGVCPLELAVKGSGDGRTVACKSACLALNRPEYCCTGDYGSPKTCSPSGYSRIFKSQCPHAYSYAFDDVTSTFYCRGGGDYRIMFCP